MVPESELGHFGPLLPKINGKEGDKFVYLHLSTSEGLLKVVSVEDETILLVNASLSTISYVFYIVPLEGTSGPIK